MKIGIADSATASGVGIGDIDINNEVCLRNCIIVEDLKYGLLSVGKATEAGVEASFSDKIPEEKKE